MTTIAELSSTSPEETIQIGMRLAARLVPGDFVALVGQLGAGKTQLTKGLAVGLGVADKKIVSSPTFVLVNEYAGRGAVFHIDAYRLAGSGEFEALGVDEMSTAGGVVVVEWADRVVEALPPAALWVDLSVTGETSRRLVLRTADSAVAARLAKFDSAV